MVQARLQNPANQTWPSAPIELAEGVLLSFSGLDLCVRSSPRHVPRSRGVSCGVVVYLSSRLLDGVGHLRPRVAECQIAGLRPGTRVWASLTLLNVCQYSQY